MLHLTEWKEFSQFDPAQLASTGEESLRCVIDGRGTLDAHRWRTAGWAYRVLGTADARLSIHDTYTSDLQTAEAA